MARYLGNLKLGWRERQLRYHETFAPGRLHIKITFHLYKLWRGKGLCRGSVIRGCGTQDATTTSHITTHITAYVFRGRGVPVILSLLLGFTELNPSMVPSQSNTNSSECSSSVTCVPFTG